MSECEHIRAFSERWDSAYCALCHEWLEPACKCPRSEACEYSPRPAAAS